MLSPVRFQSRPCREIPPLTERSIWVNAHASVLPSLQPLAREHADIPSGLLAQVQTKTVLVWAGAARGRESGAPAGEHRVTERASPFAIQEAQHAQRARVP